MLVTVQVSLTETEIDALNRYLRLHGAPEVSVRLSSQAEIRDAVHLFLKNHLAVQVGNLPTRGG